MVRILTDVRKALAIVIPKQHIFLLSHMRAYSSLIGHILGSNPAICGYYEMHMGYHSWRSLIRQKLIYFKEEDAKPDFTYMFDKILHNEHAIEANVLNSSRVRSIFCLRRPQEVIPSILKLYSEVDPSHEFNSESFATSYYIQRLAKLESIAASLDRGFFYLDAESVKNEPEECLGELSDWLQLDTALSPNYKIQLKTAKERYGDTSQRLQAGRITGDHNGRTQFAHDEELLAEATNSYLRVRRALIQMSARRCLHEWALQT